MVMLRHALRSNLKLKHLNLLVALDDFRNVGKVAEYLYTTQPSVSKTLADIEATFGADLFKRSTRGTHPTPSGELLIRFARETLASLDRAGAELNALEGGGFGRVNLGTMVLGASDMIPRGIRLMKEQSAHTTVRIEEGSTEILLRRLKLGELDVVISRLETAVDVPDLATEFLYDESIVIASHPDHPFVNRRQIEWAELSEQPWVTTLPGTFSRSKFDMVFGQHGVDVPTDVSETGSFLPLLTLTRERRALATMPGSLVRYFEDLGLLSVIPVTFMSATGGIGIITLHSRATSAAAALLIECMRKVSRSLLESASTP